MDGNNAAVRLFISDLPETTDTMIPGGVYAMIAETPPARFPALAVSMSGAAQSGVTVTLLVATAPKIFIERLSQVGFPYADEALDTGRFQVFQFQDDFSKKMFRFGTDAFLSELDHFRLPAHSYLVVDQADDLLSLHDINLGLSQAEVLGVWARKLKVTVLLVFTRLASVPSAMATLTGLMDHLSGIVRLGGFQDGLDLTFEYWQSPSGTIAAKAYGLSILDTGLYRVKPVETPLLTAPAVSGVPYSAAPSIPKPELDETSADIRYLYINPCIAELGERMPGHWLACDSIVSVIRAAFGARAPTVLLVFERDTVLSNLAEAVHTLRLSLGKRARIVVIEREASLRYSNEILLLRLGTSLVVNRSVETNRMPLMLESLHGQVFNRDVEMNFEAALSSVMASPNRGYLVPSLFTHEVTAVLNRAEMLNLPCAMVVATPSKGKADAELLAKIRLSRTGDLSSTDGVHCFLFFHGVPESSLPRALQTVVGSAPETLFSRMQFMLTRDDIRERLSGLLYDTMGKDVPESISELSAIGSRGPFLSPWSPAEQAVTLTSELSEMPPYGDASLHTKDDLYGSPDADIAVEPCGDELVIESDVVVENNFDDGSISRHPLTSEIDQVVASSEQPITDHPIVVNLPVDVLDDVPSAVVSTLPTEHMSGSPQKRPLRRAVRRFADADTTGHGKPPPVEVGRPT
jgi:cellulose biosynthesis protein BcsE